jgi:hypothetical protein
MGRGLGGAGLVASGMMFDYRVSRKEGVLVFVVIKVVNGRWVG